jgi:hypothetical protein
MKRKDWLIIGGVLLLAAVAFLVSQLTNPKSSGAAVTVYVGGEVYARVSASDYQTITIDQGDGKVNVVVIDETGVRMESSTCKNQLCVQHAPIDPNNIGEIEFGNWIICMPNGVSVEVTGGEGGQ